MATTSVITPNTHPIRDPAFARAEVTKFLLPGLDVGEEMAVYASDLLLRLSQSGKRDIADLVVIATVFRQCLVCFDGALILLREGAVQSAMPLNRALLEASLSLEWILTRGKDRWARQYYVSSLRERLFWNRRLIPGTTENEAYVKDLGEIASSLALDAAALAKVEQETADLVSLLTGPIYGNINQEIEAHRNPPKPAKKRKEPRWYGFGSGSVSDIRQLAKELGRSAEYVTLYRYLSHSVHGTLAEGHAHVEKGQVLVYPIRHLGEFAHVLSNVLTLMLTAIHKLIEHYRPGELPALLLRMKGWSSTASQVAKAKVVSTPQPFQYGES